jgi:hypothetical protein
LHAQITGLMRRELNDAHNAVSTKTFANCTKPSALNPSRPLR